MLDFSPVLFTHSMDFGVDGQISRPFMNNSINLDETICRIMIFQRVAPKTGHKMDSSWEKQPPKIQSFMPDRDTQCDAFCKLYDRTMVSNIGWMLEK
jgi:hypothetical protein